MKPVTMALAVLCFCGCRAPQVRTPPTERDKAYLDELQLTRNRQYGPCMATYRFLKDTGKEGVPTVLKAIELHSGAADASLRALILNGVSYYSRGAGAGDIVLPIMLQASRDPDARVSGKARDWLQARQKKP
jgi:hypothetical protein